MDAYNALQSQGFAVIRNAVPEELCLRALASIGALKDKHQDACKKNSDEHGYLSRVVNLHLAVDELADCFAENSPALAVCDQFFGEQAALYTSLYYERGSEQALHRDTPYFCTKPAGKYLGLWLALDDVDDNNGPLRVVPESHLLPPIDVPALKREIFPDGQEIPSISDAGWNGYQGAVQKQCDDRNMTAQPVHVRRGDAIIWHPEMFHGGAPHIERSRSRRSLVSHVTPAGVPVYHIDVFYNPAKPVPEKATWGYYQRSGRKIAKFDQVDFGHEYAVPAKSLR